MSFDFKIWLKTGLIDGYKQASFSMPYITTMTANYIVAGMLTQTDAADIATACAEWDAELARIEEEKKAQEAIDDVPTVLPIFPEDEPVDEGSTEDTTVEEPAVLPAVEEETDSVVV